ncbi:hypothetical protein MPH_03750 [Macrophomina phaseolina MS6]|uniref:Uncharacterized protein n=1 Tax=Macrophomina phaseolina (strain MS6) TaxID=1126212 RepID=K2SQY0_MACPH|nr:hypothetical protein MPH_03750 [Macrophomina phaseolina MS6]
MFLPTYGAEPMTGDDTRPHNISCALEELDTMLARLRVRRDENALRRYDLEEILQAAASFAFLLFSHRNPWVFDGQMDHVHEPGSVVILPALLQVTDEHGQWLSIPLTFGEEGGSTEAVH